MNNKKSRSMNLTALYFAVSILGIISVAHVAIITDYGGIIDVKFDNHGGQLRMVGRSSISAGND